MFRDDQRREEAAREARRRSNEEAVQSAFLRGLKPQLELVKGRGSGERHSVPSCRGVEEATFAPAGYRAFLTVSADGELLEQTFVVERLATPRYIEHRHKLLELADPERTLEVI